MSNTIAPPSIVPEADGGGGGVPPPCAHKHSDEKTSKVVTAMFTPFLIVFLLLYC